jgi:hypothetical protein
VNPGSRAPLGTRIRAPLFALPAYLYTAECANDADEGPAIPAGVAFRRALLVVAGPANHRVAFAEDLAHSGDCGGGATELKVDRSAAPDR